MSGEGEAEERGEPKLDAPHGREDGREGPDRPEGPEAAEPKKLGAPALQTYMRRAPAYLALFDFGARPRTKAGWIIRIAAVMVACILFERRVVIATQKITTAHPPPPIPTEEIEDYKFKLPERTRHEIFDELATAELAERARAIQANTWGGHLWSREDDRGHYERAAVRGAAQKRHLAVTQVYLVLDEGIREHWLAPNGEPLPATTPPLSIRSNSW